MTLKLDWARISYPRRTTPAGIAAFGVLLALSGCPNDKGDSGDPTGAASSSGGATVGDESAGVTDGQGNSSSGEPPGDTSSSSGDPPDLTSTSSSSGDPPETTGANACEQVAVLSACELPEPCPTTEIDSCGMEGCFDAAIACMWPVMRDTSPARLRWSSFQECEALWIVVGDAERSVLTTHQEGPQDAPVVRCPLAPAQFFQDCIDALEPPDECFLSGNFFDLEQCVTVDDPTCPAP